MPGNGRSDAGGVSEPRPAAGREPMGGLLDEAARIMQDRARRLAGATRLHEPTMQEPRLVVVVDEAAALAAYQSDREARNRIAHCLALLLTDGRAVSVSPSATSPTERC